MYLSRACKFKSYIIAGVAILLLAPSGLMAQTTKKNSSSSSSSAPPPKSAPARSGSPGGAAGSGGPSANRPSGPSANHPSGPSANHPSGPSANSNGGNVPHGGAAADHATPQAKGISGKPAPSGSQQVQLKNGSSVQKRPNGSISDVHDAKRGMDIHNGLNGSRRVSVDRPDHSRVVAERGRPGYVQRGFNHNGRAYERRAYFYHGRAYDRYYRGYYYHGAYVNVYAPYYYYGPGFYGWAYNPWGYPIAYSWGWGGSPWYGYYGAYFSPYPAYPSASFWLTDYMISSDLQASYQAQQDAGLPPPDTSGESPLTPEVKQLISNEVKNELALENAEAQQTAQGQEIDPASSGIARLLSDGQPHVFVAGSSLDVVDASGAECALSDSDALELTTPPPADATTASLVVLSSKGGKECPKSATVTVAVDDLQDMQNHMRETIDQGLKDLQAKQGKGGLPATPPSATAAPVNVAFVKDAPPPEQNGPAVVNQQLADSNQAETQAIGEVAPAGSRTAPSAPAATTKIALGQTIGQVTSALGQPISEADLGAKKIYNYKDMKITFRDGKVANVQ